MPDTAPPQPNNRAERRAAARSAARGNTGSSGRGNGGGRSSDGGGGGASSGPGGTGSGRGRNAGPTPEKVPSKPLTRLLKIAIAVAVVCVAGGLAGLWYGLHRETIPSAPAREAAQTFFNDLQTKSYHDAYLYLCSTTQHSFNETTFVKNEQDKLPLLSYTIVTVSTSRVNGQPAATATVNVNRGRGASTSIEHHSVPMIQDPTTKQWLICGEPY